MSEASKKLRTIKERHGLTYGDIAELAGVSVKTVERWLASPKAASFAPMPPRSLRLVSAELPGFLRRKKKKA